MSNKIKLSPAATDLMYKVRQRLRLDGQDDLWTLRIAAARSLQANSKVDDEAFELDNNESASKRSKELALQTFEQRDSLLFRALLVQHYHRAISDDEYSDLITRHIEHGLKIIHSETQNFSGYEYLVAIAKSGLGASKRPPIPINSSTNYSTLASEGFSSLLELQIGIDKTSKRPCVIGFNQTKQHPNNHIGIIGKPGSGKTTLIKNLLKQIRQLSGYQVNFVLFDYAKGDIANDDEFIRNTKAEVIRAGQQPLPVNVFQLTEVAKPTVAQQKMSAERIVQTFRDVEANIGEVQKNNLYNAINSAYISATNEGDQAPDFQMVRSELEQISPKPDSLSSVLRPLTEHNLFVGRKERAWTDIASHTVIFDIHELPASKDLCVFLVLNELYRQLMVLPDSKVDPVTSVREMRTIIVLDEAHHFLSNKKRVKVLENLIREVRSKGVSVVLLSQSPDDYNQAEFNFLELLEFVFVLSCNPTSSRFIEQVFGVSSANAKRLISHLSSMPSREAVAKSFDKKGQVMDISL